MNRNHVQNILPKRLNEYMLEAEEDLKLNEQNLREKAMLRSSLAAKWLRYGYEETAFKKNIANQIEQLREALKTKIFVTKNQAITNQSAAVDKLINLDVERELQNSADYKKLKAALASQEDIIRLIMEVQKIIAQFGYDINNSKSVVQLEQIF